MRFFQIFNPLWAEAAAQGQSFVQVFNANGQKFRNMGDSHTHIYMYNTVLQKLGEKVQKFYCIISRQKDILQTQKLIDFYF